MFGVKSARIAAWGGAVVMLAATLPAAQAEERHYAGVINGELSVIATIATNDKGEVGGEYRYTKHNMPILLSGKHAKNEITLQESGDGGGPAPTFTLTETAKGLSGFWKSGDGKRAFAAEFKKIGETVELKSSKEKVYSALKAYVKLEGKSDFFTALNAKFEAEARKDFADSAKELESMRDDATAAGMTEAPYYSHEQVMLFYAGESLVSIRKQLRTYTGGAHGNLGFAVCNYAWREGKVVALSAKDVLPLTDASRKLFREKVIKKLQAAGASWPDDAMTNDREYPTEANFTAGGIILSFGPYEVGPFAEGPHMVGFSWSELKGILDDKSVLNALTK